MNNHLLLHRHNRVTREASASAAEPKRHRPREFVSRGVCRWGRGLWARPGAAVAERMTAMALGSIRGLEKVIGEYGIREGNSDEWYN